MIRGHLLLFLILAVGLMSCQSVKHSQKNNESMADVKEAVKTIAETVSGQEMSDKDVNKLIKDLRTDPEAQSAVKVIKDSLSGDDAGRIKYSPATGKRYAPHLEYDPETGVKLEYVD